MNTPGADPAPSDETPVDSVSEHISQNINSILAFYRREEQKMSNSQSLLETVWRIYGPTVVSRLRHPVARRYFSGKTPSDSAH
jgi:hypothetical protein